MVDTRMSKKRRLILRASAPAASEGQAPCVPSDASDVSAAAQSVGGQATAAAAAAEAHRSGSSNAVTKSAPDDIEAKLRRRVPQPRADFNRSRCAARTFGGGTGAQCMRQPTADSEYCSQHLREANSRQGLSHGRMDGPVPPAKIAAFMDLPKTSAEGRGRPKRGHHTRVARGAAALDDDAESSSTCDDDWDAAGNEDESQSDTAGKEDQEAAAAEAEARPGSARRSPSGARPSLRSSASACALRGGGASESRSRASRRRHPSKESVHQQLQSLDIDEGLCMARVWGGGRGSQCSRSPKDGCDYCKLHAHEALSGQGGLTHGRIDGPVPAEKLEHFVVANINATSRDRLRASWTQQRDNLRAARAGFVSRLASAPRRAARSWFAVLSEETSFLLLSCLQQSEIFRAAMSCVALFLTAESPRLYRRLQAGCVGVNVTKRGRKSISLGDSMGGGSLIPVVMRFLEQPRFVEAEELDLSRLFLGDEFPEENRLLRHAALQCPNLRLLRLGMAKPSMLWSDFARRLSPAFERSLRSWWRSRPFVVEIYQKRYVLHDSKGQG
eukprot:TRINITY_DN32027_c0_g1_i1.p1 TRINITY_DN32027_c0_g1~~TRINITY_DN32027_c0_g1_i1.p1  ORF type:complete len:569 (-),score=123.72 TRINITY_DN32027_c0_g1_i1:767-2437(-)